MVEEDTDHVVKKMLDDLMSNTSSIQSFSDNVTEELFVAGHKLLKASCSNHPSWTSSILSDNDVEMPEIMLELSNIGHTQFKRNRRMQNTWEYERAAIGTFEDHALYHTQIGLHLNNTSADRIAHYSTPEH